jgi:predicted phage terminase large subunit-like protein
MNKEDLIKLYKEFERADEVDSFFREIRNLPVSPTHRSFRKEHFQYHVEVGGNIRPMMVFNEEEKQTVHLDTSESNLIIFPNQLTNVVLVDPAKTVKMQSADSAIVGVGVDRTGRNLYVRDIVNGKMYPEELYKNMFDMVLQLKAAILAVEVTSLHEFISQPIRDYMRRKGISVIFHEVNARGKKEERVAALVPYYRQGLVSHNKACCQGLESQLLSFPASALCDIMDAFAHIIPLMDNPDYALWFDPIGYSNFPTPDEYEDIENDLDDPVIIYGSI